MRRCFQRADETYMATKEPFRRPYRPVTLFGHGVLEGQEGAKFY